VKKVVGVVVVIVAAAAQDWSDIDPYAVRCVFGWIDNDAG